MASIDTRLLSVFDEIYRTRSVSAAAEGLGLGQPAVSVALSKLRQHFGDPLFVRTSSGMEPTPFAEGLAGGVRTALEAVTAVLDHTSEFDPATSGRAFRVCMTDISQLVVLPGLWNLLRLSAPNVRIEVMPISADTPRALESGEADLALGYMPKLEAGFFQQLLFNQTFVCVVSAKHPRIGDSLDIAQYQSEKHLVVRSSSSAPALVDHEIVRQGIRRQIGLHIPTFVGAVFIAANTDLILTVPKLLGDLLATRGELKTFPVPFPLPQYSVRQHWHQRFHHDQGNRWLRQTIFEMLSG